MKDKNPTPSTRLCRAPFLCKRMGGKGGTSTSFHFHTFCMNVEFGIIKAVHQDLLLLFVYNASPYRRSALFLKLSREDLLALCFSLVLFGFIWLAFMCCDDIFIVRNWKMSIINNHYPTICLPHFRGCSMDAVERKGTSDHWSWFLASDTYFKCLQISFFQIL